MLRLGLAGLSLHLGFVEYNADGFTRIIHGFEWLERPRWEVGVWLPLQFWLIGGVLAIWRDLYAAPKLLSTIAGLATIANLGLIAWTLGGRRAAALAALLAAAFPYEVWFSVSGMSEPIFHALLTAAVLGLTRWWVRTGAGSKRAGGKRAGLKPAPTDTPLLLGAVALGAATAVRYEAWFYAVAFAGVILVAAWRRRTLGPGIVLGALVPFLFILVWVEQSAAVFGSPLAFANQTAAIKTELAPQNATASLLQRLVYFPEATFQTSRVLVTLGVLAAGWLAWRRPGRWGGYLALVAGQAALLVAVSAAFANIGPGSERYLLSNVLLLIPLLAAALSGAEGSPHPQPLSQSWERGDAGGRPLTPSPSPNPGRGGTRGGPLTPSPSPNPGRGGTRGEGRLLPLAVAAVVLLLLAASFGRALAAPPRDYPDADARQVGAFLADELRTTDPLGRAAVPVLLPPPPADAYNAGYALRILSGHPSAVIVTDQSARLVQLVADGTARLWIVDTATGVALPPAERTRRIGRFVIGWPAPVAQVVASPSVVRPGDTVTAVAGGLEPGEPLAAWLTAPGEAVTPLPDAQADAGGQATLRVQIPSGASPGRWALTVDGRRSHRQGIAAFEVRR